MSTTAEIGHGPDRHALLQQGSSLLDAGNARGALLAFLEGTSRFPEDWRFPGNAAIALHRQRQVPEALRLISSALRLAPEELVLYHRLGAWLLELGQFEAGIRMLEQAVELKPDDVESLLQLGTAYLETKQDARAGEVAERAISTRPALGEPHLLRGYVLAAQGRKEESEAAMLRVLELDPRNAQAYHHLARRGLYQDAQTLERLLAEPGISAASARRLHFALGDIYDRTGRPELAFPHFERGNLLASRSWQPEGNRRMTLDIASICTGEFIEKRTALAGVGHQPIFIVGVPRTGSSLLEQILARHSGVHAVGEHLLGTPRLVNQLPGLRAGVRIFPAGLCDLTQADIGELARRYLDSLPAAPRAGLRVVDKMLSNFQLLGMLAPMFPDARIVNCRRDPRACALSAYFLEFHRNELPWSYDLDHLASYHRDYEVLMDHWRAHLPLPILDVRYEDLVAEPEEWTRRVLEFCELDFEVSCLSHEESDQRVFTASALQVREKIHARAVARWKPYEAHLGHLNDLGSAYWKP